MTSRRVGPIAGARAILAGIPLTLSEPTIRRRFIKALIVNGLVFLLLLALVIWGAFALTSGLMDESWYVAALGWLARLAVVAGLILIGPVLFAIVGDIFLPIFHGPIFEAARDWAGGPSVTEADGGLGTEVRNIGVDIRRLVKFLLLSALLLFLNLVPVVGNLAYFALQLGLAAHSMGWDLLGPHFELHGLRYDQQREFLRRNRALVLAIGLVGEVLCLIPIAQFVFVTTNVAGAGILSAKLDRG